MPTTELTPNNKLTSRTGDKFVLFTRNWLSLQTYIQAGLELPISKNGFVDKYGAFDKTSLITGCVEAMKDVHALATTFGMPRSIQQQMITNPSYLGSDTPPNELYGHMIWLGSQIYRQSTTFAHTLSSLGQTLAPLDTNQRAAATKSILTGPGGLTTTASTAIRQASELMIRLGNFTSSFDNANKHMKQYTSNASEIRKAASSSNAHLVAEIARVQQTAAEAYKRWRDYTISTVHTPVGITILTAGLLWPSGLGLGAGLGAITVKARDAYNSLCDEIGKEQANTAKKLRLLTDLSGLDAQLVHITQAMGEFKSCVEQIQGVWVDVNNSLNAIISNHSDAQLGNIDWLTQAMKLKDAAHRWQAIGDSAQGFVQNSMVPMNTQAFGEKLAV
ncbi:MAG: alpha-xenorhabdolysin family binary toxin subunit A [Myxococcota bacterium]